MEYSTYVHYMYHEIALVRFCASPFSELALVGRAGQGSQGTAYT